MPFQLPGQEEKRDYVHEQFERIAQRYDLTNDAISLGMHRSWKRLAVGMLLAQSERNGNGRANGSGGRYLDVCCGTGDLAISIARRLGKGGTVVGLDFSAAMLSVAKARAVRLQTNGIVAADLEWFEGDALDLPFDSHSFDGAIISFGLRNLTDLERGLAEMARVVKPGGAVINLDLGKPQGVVFPSAFRLFFRYIVPLIGQVLQNDRKAYTYLPESMNTYPSPDGISSLFESVGLADVTHIPLSGGSVALHKGTVA